MISHPKWLATSIETSVFPTPVGPRSTIKLLFIGYLCRRLFFLLVQALLIVKVGERFLIVAIEKKIVYFRFIFILFIVGYDDIIIELTRAATENNLFWRNSL
jgi:hypothetical protein